LGHRRRRIVWALFWQGQQQQPTKDGNSAARALFEHALEIEPNNTDALAGAAYTYFLEYVLGWTTADTDYDLQILGRTDRAIALAPDNIWAYYVKSQYLVNSRRPNEALSAADAGLALNPNDPPLLRVRGLAEIYLERFEQGKSDILNAMRISPRDPRIGLWQMNLGDAELGLGHFDAAIENYQKAIDAGFRSYIPYRSLAAAYALGGKMDEARSALAEARRLNPKLTVKWMQAHSASLAAALEGLRKAGLPEE